MYLYTQPVPRASPSVKAKVTATEIGHGTCAAGTFSIAERGLVGRVSLTLSHAWLCHTAGKLKPGSDPVSVRLSRFSRC